MPSESFVAAVVCEGQTDFPIFEEIIYALWPTVDRVFPLQPELDEMGLAKGPAGWTQVKAWCEQHAADLDSVLEPDLGAPIDLLIVAMDVDVAVEAGIEDPPQEVGVYETKRLRATMEGWLLSEGKSRLPPAVMTSTPVMAIEAWVIAALFPRERAGEKIADGAQFLVDKKKLRSSPSDGKPWKERYLYQAFAKQVGAKLRKVRGCAEADRTCAAIERRRDAVSKG